ncbi:trehalose operon repressor [Bacillus gobiensis]|uniref:trehalose operon repressor n=1 Tax=Bacillus gobiensis TaxID=1441095 RepID=UPI003D1FEAE9
MTTNKYDSIYQELAKKIDQGIVKAEDILPSENELSLQYETSRETVRKALNLLAQNGYIQKIRGKGSVVLNVEKMRFPVSGLVSFKELSKTLGRRTCTKVHEFGLIHPDPYLCKQLKAEPDDEIWRIIRSREINGDNVILDKDYIYRKCVPMLTQEICENSIYEYIEDELGMKIGFAQKEFVVEACTEEDEKYLDHNGFDHIVVVRNFVFLEDATLFQYTESRHRLDKFRFVDFARRGR